MKTAENVVSDLISGLMVAFVAAHQFQPSLDGRRPIESVLLARVEVQRRADPPAIRVPPRQDVPQHRVPGIEEVCLTTNGVRLAEMAPDLLATGLRHLNLSLDSLRRDRYRELTGFDHFDGVMAGLERAAALGFAPIKINCVVLKDLNDDELLDFARLTQDHPFQVRFIEFMPTVDEARWRRHFLPMAEIRRRLAKLGPLEAVAAPATAGPARTFRVPGFRGELGFISSVSDHHCPTCNRLRLTAAGWLRPCLFAAPELDIKGPLRRGASEAALAQLFREAIRLKGCGSSAPLASPWPPPSMVSIGG